MKTRCAPHVGTRPNVIFDAVGDRTVFQASMSFL